MRRLRGAEAAASRTAGRCSTGTSRRPPGSRAGRAAASAIPASASAICCTSVAGTVTGDIAPISRNGVITTGLVRRGCTRASRPACGRRSEAASCTLISEIDDRRALDRLARRRCRISLMRIVSAAFGPDVTEPMWSLSESVCRAYTMSRWRESSGRSLGSQIVPPGGVELGERLREPHELLEVGHRRLAAVVALAHERRPVHARRTTMSSPPTCTECSRVAGAAGRTRAAPWRPARARSRGRGRRSRPRSGSRRRGRSRPPRGG